MIELGIYFIFSYLGPNCRTDIREKRPPYTFKSGAIYDGEWKGNARVTIIIPLK